MPLDYLTCFVMVLHGYMGTFDIHKTDYGFTPNLKFSPYHEVIQEVQHSKTIERF